MKKNIVLILVDQMRRDCLGVMGHPVVETPTLDMMKRNGSMFRRAYSGVPSCIAARASILTGLKQSNHGRVGYKDGIDWNYKTTIASEFSKAGYQTQSIGKMHVHPERNLCGFHNVILHDGYMHYARNSEKSHSTSYEQCDDYLYWLRSKKGNTADLIDLGLDCNSWVARPWTLEEEYHPTNFCASQTIDFLRRRDPRKPFFLMTSFVRPHSPLDPPEYYFNMYMNQLEDLPDPVIGEWADKNDFKQDGLNIHTKEGIVSKKAIKRALAAYYGHISHIDHQINRILIAFGEYGLMNNTIFLFASDHGDLLGDHNFYRKALPYEGSSGVPFIVYDPANLLKSEQNRVFDNLVELRDIMPTLLDAAGLEIPNDIDGKSMIPVIRGEAENVREYLHGEHSFDKRSNHWIVTEKDKYIWYNSTNEEQYFDLENDFSECYNLIDNPEKRERINYLRNLLINELNGREEGFTDGSKLFKTENVKDFISTKYN